MKLCERIKQAITNYSWTWMVIGQVKVKVNGLLNV